jgi:hypothetical protein
MRDIAASILPAAVFDVSTSSPALLELMRKASPFAFQGFGLALELDDPRAAIGLVGHRLLDPAERRLEPQECLIQFLNVCHQSLW